MAKSLTASEHARILLGHVLQHGQRLIRKWEPQLDRLEEFATHVGEEYTRRLDGPLVAMGIGFLALLGLAFS